MVGHNVPKESTNDIHEERNERMAQSYRNSYRHLRSRLHHDWCRGLPATHLRNSSESNKNKKMNKEKINIDPNKLQDMLIPMQWQVDYGPPVKQPQTPTKKQ